MKDYFDTEISVGSRVAWVGGLSQYSGVNVFYVTKITPKGVKIDTGRGYRGCSTFVKRDCVIVVDSLIKEDS